MPRPTVVLSNRLVVLFAVFAIVWAFAACGSSSTRQEAQCPCTCASSGSSATMASTGAGSSSTNGVQPSVASASSTGPNSGASGNPHDYTPHEMAEEHAENARIKANQHDGAGCLAELAEHDKLDPRHPSTDPKHAHVAYVRAQCLMLVGQCTAGRELYKQLSAGGGGALSGPEQAEKVADAMVGLYCQGGDMTPRDRMLRARMDLTNGAWQNTKDRAFCMSAYQTAWSLRNVVKPRDDNDTMVKDTLPFLLSSAPACLARAGDCDGAYSVYKDVAREYYKGATWTNDEKTLRTTFESMNAKCKK